MTKTPDRNSPAIQYAMRLQQLAELTLQTGGHSAFAAGHCAMELVSWLADEPFSASPTCTDSVLASFVVLWNDGLPNDKERTRLLRPFLSRLIGTRATPEISLRRSWMAMDWLVRVCTPAFLALTPSLREHAQTLSGLPPVLSRKALDVAMPRVAAAWAAARDAAGAAARAALRPTVAQLQDSASALLDRMIRLTEAPEQKPAPLVEQIIEQLSAERSARALEDV